MVKSDKEQIEKWHKDSKNWKLGVFYFNKKDSRIFVDKPNPNFGITLNFANPKSLVVIIVSAFFFGLIMYMIDKNK